MSERNVLKHITKTRNIQSRNIYNYSIVCVVFCEIGQCIAVCVSQWFLSSVSRCIKLTFHDSFSKFWDSVYTRGSPEEDRCCVHVLPISSEALWGEKKENSESSRRASARNMSVHFFFLLLALLPSPTATSPRYASQNSTSVYFVQKHQEATARSFHFWLFESLRRASAWNMSVYFFSCFCCLCHRATLCFAKQKNISVYFVQKYQIIIAQSSSD